MKEIKIKIINDKSPYLESVIKLGDANKKTLGFFSRGAFINQASKGLIIVAINDCNNCVGYLMYRIAKKVNQVKLVHLCIDREYRGQKIGSIPFWKIYRAN